MFSLIFGKIGRVGVAILGAFSLFLIGRNSRLSKQNQKLNSNLQGQSKLIEAQKKVINVTKNTKSTNINGNIKRMRKNEL